MNDADLLGQGLARPTEVDLLAYPLEKRDADGLFHAPDRDRNGRLGQMDGFRRLGEAAMMGHCLEDAKLLQGDVHLFSLCFV